MAEKLSFHFEGSIADQNKMNFYEAARFQYAAARLMVKLAQFRQQGSFVKNITNVSNFDINLSSHRAGSFNINVEDNTKKSSAGNFVDASMSDLISYVGERVIGKIDESSLDKTLIEAFTQTAAGEAVTVSVDGGAGPSITSALDKLVEAYVDNSDIANEWPSQIKDLVTRRLAEMVRARRLEEQKSDLSKIDLLRDQKLISMSAPLIGEMATALRKSADTLEIRSSFHSRQSPVLFLDQKMAKEIEAAVVDKDITTILCDVIQFNKDNGWGKVKIDNGSKTISFNIPSDVMPIMKQKLIDSMRKDLVYLQTYFVRDKAKQVIRLIAVGVLPTPSN
ncbi:hypothetical protein [Aureimonas ureilytica]|uniref:hypothetical protein n=1 Tax=Aureimonas ureilytica TaxID=401562 RepID=UPI0009EB7116|nr:hypothetical protein [Aureimonas ureilytica]